MCQRTYGLYAGGEAGLDCAAPLDGLGDAAGLAEQVDDGQIQLQERRVFVCQ